MKQQRFRLGSVLKHYELQKQRAELSLQQAIAALRRIDEEIARLNGELAGLSGFVVGSALASLSASAWIACSRQSEHLGQTLEKTWQQRARQVDAVAKCNETRKRWAIAEETLLLLRRRIEATNEAEAARTNDLQLQETILRRWLAQAEEDGPDTQKGNLS